MSLTMLDTESGIMDCGSSQSGKVDTNSMPKRTEEALPQGFNRLPRELQLKILDSFDSRRSSEDRATLARCLRVFRPLTEAILERLYRYLAWGRCSGSSVPDQEARIQAIRLNRGRKTYSPFGRHAHLVRHVIAGAHERFTGYLSNNVRPGVSNGEGFREVDMLHLVAGDEPPYSDDAWQLPDDLDYHSPGCDLECGICRLVFSLAPSTLLVDARDLSSLGSMDGPFDGTLPVRFAHRLRTIIIRCWDPDCLLGLRSCDLQLPSGVTQLVVLCQPGTKKYTARRGRSSSEALQDLVVRLIDLPDMFTTSLAEPPHFSVRIVGLETQAGAFTPTGISSAEETPKVLAAQFARDMEGRVRGGIKDRLRLRRLRSAATTPDSVPREKYHHQKTYQFLSLRRYAEGLEGVKRDALTRSTWEMLDETRE